MNLVIPIASSSKFFNTEEYGYPKPLIEILGRPMIELVIENLTKDVQYKKIIFILRQEDCEKYHLDNTLKLLCPHPPEIIKLQGETQGALCSVLLAVDLIVGHEMLVIANADQIFDGGTSSFLSQFISSNLEAGCITFDSVHPRWAYVKTDGAGYVIETAEKNPISKYAIAGFYMYKTGSDFIRFAMESIKRGLGLNEKYFISPVFNEYVLAGMPVGKYQIPNHDHHTFYSPQKIDEFEALRQREAS
jgi:dTDP-glucose pyrophosphorylase